MLAVQLVPRAAQQEVLVVGLVVRHANARVRIQRILERDLAFQDGGYVRVPRTVRPPIPACRRARLPGIRAMNSSTLGFSIGCMEAEKW